MKKLALTLRKGETVAIPLRIESSVLVYKAITAIAKSAPVSITAEGHDLANGWDACVMNAKGMKQINAEENPPADAEFRPVTVVDADTVQFNSVNAAGYSTYTGGGQIVYYAPLDLAAYASARMSVKDAVGGTEILSFTTSNGRLEFDAATNTLWLRMTSEDSELIEADEGVFDIELVTPGGEVKAVCSAESTITFLPEVTT